MEAPTFFHSSFCPQFPAFDNNKNNNTDNFIVEDLLDLPNDDAIITDANIDSVVGNSTDSSTVTAVDSCNSSSFSGSDPLVAGISPVKTISPVSSDGNFSGELCVPYDDLAELEWLSNFVEESFSSEDLHKMQLISGVKAQNDNASKVSESHAEPKRNSPSPSPGPIFNTKVSVPAKARTKRTRAAPCNWTSRLLVLSPTTSFSEPELFIPTPIHPSSVVAVPVKKPAKSASRRKDNGDGGSGGDGRKCQHCATDKTPQWRTGPMGPKTLCNACGVRYKSGRLVPEYRPASSPTFVLTKHSNSHRKVMELRRQKEMVRAQQHQQHQPFLHPHHHPNVMFDVSNGDDYLIYQHVGPDFRQLI